MPATTAGIFDAKKIFGRPPPTSSLHPSSFVTHFVLRQSAILLNVETVEQREKSKIR